MSYRSLAPVDARRSLFCTFFPVFTVFLIVGVFVAAASTDCADTSGFVGEFGVHIFAIPQMGILTADLALTCMKHSWLVWGIGFLAPVVKQVIVTDPARATNYNGIAIIPRMYMGIFIT